MTGQTVTENRVWLSAKSAAAYLDYDTTTPKGVRAFREWARRNKHRVPPRHQGRRVLFARADIDRTLNPGAKFRVAS
jgi:hypothetical protein